MNNLETVAALTDNFYGIKCYGVGVNAEGCQTAHVVQRKLKGKDLLRHLPGPEPFMDLVAEKFGGEMPKWTSIDIPGHWENDYAIWVVRIILPKEHNLEFAPPDLMKKIRKSLDPKKAIAWLSGYFNTEHVEEGHWAYGLETCKKCESKLYQVGERVLVKYRPDSKVKYYFVTSYRTIQDMGMFRLMRDNGVLASTAGIQKFSKE